MQSRTLGAFAVSAVLTLTCASVAYAEQWVDGDGPSSHHGTDDDDELYGMGGDDTVWGDGGNDQVFGGTGSDTLHGGEGKDNVDTGINEDKNKTKDVGYGDGGSDYVQGRGPDKLYGGAGKDYVYVLNPTENSVANCGAGHDTLYANRKHFPGKKIGCEKYVDHIGGKRSVDLAPRGIR